MPSCLKDDDDGVWINLIVGKDIMKPGANKHVNQDDKRTGQSDLQKDLCELAYI